jgi:SNF2 domain-containing protein/helicase-like protein
MLVSEVDFDPDTGRLTVVPAVEVHGQTTRIDIQALSKGRGTLGSRAFRISRDATSALMRAAQSMRWSGSDTLICDDDRVPEIVELLRSTPQGRLSNRAGQVTTRDAQLHLSLSTDPSSSLRSEASAVVDQIRLPVSATAETGAMQRKGATFVRIPPIPQALREALGALTSPEASGYRDALCRLNSALEPAGSSGVSIQASDAARTLLESANTPRPSELILHADFNARADALDVTIREHTPHGQPAPRLPVALSEPHLVDGVFVTPRNSDVTVVRELLALNPQVQGAALTLRGPAIPQALTVLRRHSGSELSEAARDLVVHERPLENRTYVELGDPETLLIRQNLVDENDRTIRPPDISGSMPEWLRIGHEYFRTPTREARPPAGGKRVSPGTYSLKGDAIPDFIEQGLSEAKQTGRVLASPEAAALRVVTAAPELRTLIELDETTGQVAVRPEYRSGPTRLPHSTVRQRRATTRYVRVGSTFHRMDWPLVDKVTAALEEVGLTERADGSYAGSGLHVDEIINTFSKLGVLAETEVFSRFRERLLNFTRIEPVDLPTSLKAGVQVRDYQRAGYDWIVFLKHYGLPGILADEMGLGKTLQVLLAIGHYRDRYGPCPSLIVCPAALVEKWIDEAGKFFRGLYFISHAGGRRREQLRDNIGNADGVVVSYETLVRDADYLAGWRWRLLVTDEAQRIKNATTQRAKAVRKIPAEARFAITGTPVENRLLELWSVFDFIAPSYLGTATEFTRQYADPIERRRSKHASEALVRKTRPFILRRLKRHVASELPDKLSKPLRCELTPSQRDLYQAVLDHDLEAAIAATGGRRFSLGNPHIFAILTKLKQICCHPGLITKDFSPYKTGISGKFDSFIEVVDEILDAEGPQELASKLVGFSQYVEMAGYLSGYVRSRNKTCDLIDGRVPPADRPGLCKAFNADPARFGMMLTLSAGGVGLDLQSANYVLLYDRWWNPAVEDQAVDRVHRLGQSRQVVVITLTTRGTLEEKIEHKLTEKRSLSDYVIHADELMRKEVTRAELIDLVKLD